MSQFVRNSGKCLSVLMNTQYYAITVTISKNIPNIVLMTANSGAESSGSSTILVNRVRSTITET